MAEEHKRGSVWKDVKGFFGGAPPFDETSQYKNALDKFKTLFLVVGMIGVAIWAIFNLITVVNTSDVEVTWEKEAELPFPYLTFCIPKAYEGRIIEMWGQDYFSTSDYSRCEYVQNEESKICNPVLTDIGPRRCWVVNAEKNMVAKSRNDQIYFRYPVVYDIDLPEPVVVLFIHNDNQVLEEGSYLTLSSKARVTLVLSLSTYKYSNGTLLYNYSGFMTPGGPPDTFCDSTMRVCVGFIIVTVQYQSFRVQKIAEISKVNAFYDFVSQLGGAISLVIGVANIVFSFLLTRLLFRNHSARLDNETREAILYLIKEQQQQQKQAILA